jgi:deoxyribodipyrimidine photo-lyase
MNRRVESNHALAYAISLANEHRLPVLFYEGLTCSYPFASDRYHTFLLEGVPDTERVLEEHGIGYVFYLRKRKSDPNDVLYRLAQDAAAVVTDDYPTFVARRHNASVPAKIDAAYYVVDSSCVVPMYRLEKREYAAYTIRPKIHKLLGQYLKAAPLPKVKQRYLLKRNQFHTTVTETNTPDLVQACEIDHRVGPSLAFRGGSSQAHKHLEKFLTKDLSRYANHRNDPTAHATSDLSPYLHFGHISSLEVALKARDFADKHELIPSEFLEELIVRRELAFNFAAHSPQLDSLSVLPDWARNSIEKHAADVREHVYSRNQLEHAETYDDLWNATQKELLLRGKIHGYYRMYWGKKIIEWSATHQDALDAMIYLHDRYALDGRDPNTFTNILWCFGLHDRPFVERPIFGQIRYMSYDGMKRKTNIAGYIKEIQFLEQTGKDPFRLE